MVAVFSAPYTPIEAVLPALREHGYAVLTPDSVAKLCGEPVAGLDALKPSWNDLAPDNYLRDGGSYRRRRHSCFVVNAVGVEQVPHRAHWQSEEYNALHGGMRRWFEPISAEVVAQPTWTRLLRALGETFSAMRDVPRWYVEAHQFRIDTSDGIGRPTPEGAHRDGVDFVAVFLIGRHGIKGGETRVFEAAGPNGQRFTLAEPWSLLLLDDARVIHESTPIQPLQDEGHRDTLVLTYRAGAFQGED
ncbi:2OG-Fe dioxygenase family protein [Luteimonas sp. SX5]|uniref:2OG-Fe dioxygenase family protein n=1 Tax=Luteimonas galliterrae TaxID=2940486 RepID=A0ABT0MIE3_9GAMM|nr:2OG-Fe dioxygenase family protein [Luteimonas galliterrae]MCL1634652.1 2OG-Fe dioxygenase family protein [Luteimonas galliterrae]